MAAGMKGDLQGPQAMVDAIVTDQQGGQLERSEQRILVREF